MSLSQATLELLISLKDQASSGLSSLGGALSSVGGVALGVGAAGFAALGAAIVSGVGDARESQQLLAATEQTIRTTGSAAGMSAQQVVDLATALSAASGKSLFGDAEIQKTENMLLTFTNIGKDVFPAATQATVDMAAAFHTTPEAFDQMIGKALNSADGFMALKRSGVAFTESQQEQIKTLFAAGNAADAQRIILKELNTEFGGQAAAAAQADGGWAQFRDSLGETFETIGGKLLPILGQLGAWLNSPTVQSAISTFATNLGDGIQVAATWISGTLIPALQQAWTYLQANVVPVLITAALWFRDNLPPAIAATVQFITGTLIPALQQAGGWLRDNVLPVLRDVATWLMTNLPPAIAATAQFVTGTLIPALRQAWAFLDANVVPILRDVATWLMTNIPPAIAATVQFITGTLIPALQQAWAYFHDNILPILAAVVNVGFALLKAEIRILAELWTGTLQPALMAVWNFIQTKVLPILSDLSRDISAVLGPAIDGLGKTISPIAGWFDGIGTSVGGVVTWLNNLAAGIDKVHVPAWLQGHSPPPMANWFGDIAQSAQSAGDAVGAVQPAGGSLPSLPALAGGGAGASGGGVNVNVTVQGSVTSERDLVLSIRDALNQIGRQNISIFSADVTP